MFHVAQQTESAAQAVRARWDGRPRVGLILGSGMGGLTDRIGAPTAIPYAEVPHFPSATATGHRGRLILGTMAGLPVAAMQGRFHVYEGYSASDVAFPVRVFRALGAELVIVTNAAGGLNPRYARGDLVVLDDHINLMARNPLVGIHDESLGPRFHDTSRPYDPELIEQALAIARGTDVVVHRGVYIGMTGPTYETRAEYRFLRRIGGDVVGMSTVPEVILAARMGMRVLGISVVTNVCQPETLAGTTGEEVLEAAAAAEQSVACLVLGIVQWLQGV